jgi:D-beta-D-heptose 7-phosphate kinase/D-beta-D-heptose 1-phosphate adenosyltransferase
MHKKEEKFNNNNILDVVDALRGLPVLVVGDIMLDRFVYGRVERISPESPVPVLSVTREDAMLGGAGNALSNLAGLGAGGRIIALTGDDSEAAVLQEKIAALGIDTKGLLTDSSRPTIVKTRFLAGHQQLLRSDFERRGAISDQVARAILAQADLYMKDAKALILSDYGKGLLREDVVAGLIARARKLAIPVIVDPKAKDFSIYKGASAVTPNKNELAAATGGMPVETDEDVVAASRHLIKQSGIGAVIATRSKDGLSIITKDKATHLRAADIEVFDVSGAGDTVIATFAAALAAGASLEDAGVLANAAGGVVVTKVGTAPIRADELKSAVQQSEGGAGNTKHQAPVLSWPQAAEDVRRWRARGLKIGFTNGCFDILHFGHVSYLNAARAKCDRLVVGLNSDASVRILKGEDRPVHDETSRAGVLGALGAVDMVVLFGAQQAGGDNTANELIALLQPDVYFKGGDYTEDQIPEAPGVKKYGGAVCVLPVFDGHSTTGSIKKITKTRAA